MLETSWLWFVISKEYVELTRPKIESRDPIFFTGTQSRSRVSGNDRLFPRGSEFGPNLEIPAGPAIQLRPGPDRIYLGLYSLSGKTSYRQISWSLEAARLGVIMIVSLWNLTGILDAC